MEAAGVKILFSASHMAVVGLTEVFSRLHRIGLAFLKLKHLLKTRRPDLLIPMDYPEFNIALAGRAKRYKVPVLYYISPQVWAWRRGRIKKIARRVDRMAVILPFEEEFYRKTSLNVEYVGHPLLDSFSHNLNRSGTIKETGPRNNYPILGLLPGSRSEEIRKLLPIMLKAVEILSSRYGNLECVLPIAPTISPDLVESVLKQSPLKIRISKGDVYEALTGCDLALVTSGTATLETAMKEVPMIVVYRASPITFWAAKMVVKVPFMGLVNLVAGEQVVPELIQDEVTPHRLAHEAIDILESRQKKENMIRKLRMVTNKLGKGGASQRTAKIALEMMTK